MISTLPNAFHWQSKSDRVSNRLKLQNLANDMMGIRLIEMMGRDSGKIAETLRFGVSNVSGSVLATINFHNSELGWYVLFPSLLVLRWAIGLAIPGE